MVCDKCAKELVGVVVPGVWKPAHSSSKGITKPRKTNMILQSKKRKAMDAKGQKCKKCKAKLHQRGKYCSSCAHKLGRCSRCGKKILDQKYYHKERVVK